VQPFAGSTPGAACGSSPSTLLAATPTNCDDTAVSSGSYTYTVTAVFRSWTAVSSPSLSVTVVNVGPLDHFLVTAPTSLSAGIPFSVTVTAQDAANNTV